MNLIMKMISFKIKLFFIFLSAVAFAFSGCGDQALFDELATNRITVKIKGTYESNGPRDWTWPALAVLEDDSIYLNENVVEDTPTVFMLDIAGIKVASGKHNQYFANFRKTYVSNVTNTDSLFNGEGVEYKNNDVRPDFSWQTVQIFIRKMLFNNAKQYDPSSISAWANPVDVTDMFAEKTVNGFNFNLAQVLSYYDSLKMNYNDINRIFPLSIPVEDGFIFDKNEPETVLEIRFVIKNFVKKYEYEFDDEDKNRKLRHFYALSDWLRDIKRGEPAPSTDTLGKMGGNLLAVARSYVPGKTATISRTVGVTADRCIIAVKYPHSLGEYLITSPINRPSCDEPKKPRIPITSFIGSGTSGTSDYIESLLQYYLQYEVYKQQYDSFVTCVDSGTYATDWTSYENSVSLFKIPPLVTWSDSNGYTLENVPAGEYTIYEASSAVPAGELPSTSTGFVSRGSITINESYFNTKVTGP
jgi:hypothetical protein